MQNNHETSTYHILIKGKSKFGLSLVQLRVVLMLEKKRIKNHLLIT